MGHSSMLSCPCRPATVDRIARLSATDNLCWILRCLSRVLPRTAYWHTTQMNIPQRLSNRMNPRWSMMRGLSVWSISSSTVVERVGDSCGRRVSEWSGAVVKPRKVFAVFHMANEKKDRRVRTNGRRGRVNLQRDVVTFSDRVSASNEDFSF